MTLRDWFAGQALTGLLSGLGDRLQADDRPSPTSFAKRAYNVADAMLAAGQKAAEPGPLRGAAPDLLDALEAAYKYVLISDSPASGEDLKKVEAALRKAKRKAA